MKSLFFKLLLAVASVAITLLAMEGVARVERMFRGAGKEAAEVTRYHEFDPVLGWRHTPNTRVTYRRREYTVEVAINSLGLRDPNRGYAVPAGTTRILALGDSFLEAYTVPIERTVTQVLETTLNREGTCPVEVINGGTAGYSTDQEFLFYQREGARYSPQIVLLFAFYNDISYNSHQYYYRWAKPIFQIGEKEGDPPLILHPPRALPDQEVVTAEEGEPTGSALLAWAEERLRQASPATHTRLASLGLWEPIRIREPHGSLRVFERGTLEGIEEAWWRTAKILEAFDKEVRANGSRLVIVYIPSRMEVHDASWEATRFHFGLGPGWDRRLVVARLTQIAQTLDVPVLDLTPDLREADGRLLSSAYLTFDSHWTQLGHRTAARTVADYLLENRWLACSEHAAALDP